MLVGWCVQRGLDEDPRREQSHTPCLLARLARSTGARLTSGRLTVPRFSSSEIHGACPSRSPTKLGKVESDEALKSVVRRTGEAQRSSAKTGHSGGAQLSFGAIQDASPTNGMALSRAKSHGAIRSEVGELGTAEAGSRLGEGWKNLLLVVSLRTHHFRQFAIRNVHLALIDFGQIDSFIVVL